MSDADIMGTPEQARNALIEKARAWRETRKPVMATAKQLREMDRLEHQLRFEVANAALLWLWHQERGASGE